MAFEWVAGLFQSDNQQTRGLSGDSAHTVALDESNPYYNYRLRRHKAEGDPISDPGLLWYTSPYVKRRTGLGTHVGAEVGDGTANYTDVLLILSPEDHERAGVEWQATVTRTLQQEFDNFCRRENFNRLHAHRPIGVRILEDGSPAMNSQSLQLRAGEFVTGLLPNLYTGPVRGSYPVIGVHVNLPGVWEGYQEVGRLYNDQILFTLGSHWLDNFQHPSLQEAALYRLRQYPDGSFVHIINPDLQDRYQVTSTNQGGASVLTLATRAGQPLAYMVLAVIDPPTSRPSMPPTKTLPPTALGPRPTGRPDIQLPKLPSQPQASQAPRAEARPSQSPRSERSVPSIAPPMLLDEGEGSIGLGGKTIIPDAPSERIFTFQERGALLQKVHFSAFMLGYDVYLGPRGELGTHVEDPAATFQVRRRSVSIVAHVDGVQVAGRPVPTGVEIPIEGDVNIEVAGQKVEYQDLRGLQVDGWPYVGEIRRPASSTYMIWGEDYQVGRSRECRVVLPDEPRNDNIHWKPSVGDGTTIRARTGDIPKSRFYTDSIMVASEHASIDLRGDQPKVVCTARHCYIYARRNGEVFPLYPAATPQQPKDMPLQPGDEVLVGNCLFHVGFTPAGELSVPTPAPDVAFDPDALSGAVEGPDLEALDRDSQTPPPAREATPPPPPAGEDDLPELSEEAAKPRKWDSSGEISAPVGPAHGFSAPIVDLDEDGDEPTIPGAALPRDVEDLPAWDQAAQPPSMAAREDTDVSLDEDDRDLLGWEKEEWSEDDSQGGTQRAPRPEQPSNPPQNVVPEPFPDVDEVGSDTSEPSLVPPEDGRAVVATDDADARFELARPLHLVLVGWMVNGEVTCGNHAQADLVIPENRVHPRQQFAARDYFRLKVRGKKGQLEILSPEEVRIDDAEPADTYNDPEAHTIDVLRRDDQGDPDFVVRLRLVEEKRLPDPRARFLALDETDPLAAALVTRGLPKGSQRQLTLDGVAVTFLWDGANVTASGYLATYRRAEGFHPFFVQQGGGRFKTAPEDGSTFALSPGDRLVVGSSVYVLREE
jgi:hypothetical protein